MLYNGLHEWHLIFYIGASVYIGCGLIFCVLGSGEIQPWNTTETKIKHGIENIAFDDVRSKDEEGNV
ncbi:hypothetical protein NQ314_005999 [Rhamnusium bicolor]|uniref:Uncharacterized protein n=1 Tax=Rhamnusium bicolor TaxID=1586634 RepID=A0AAV8ZD34_9CUCU|nr:hypothetical protein NQ314_005999 [Rhamnusium bicolor]